MFLDTTTEMEELCRDLIAREIGVTLLRYYPPEDLNYKEFLAIKSLRILHEVQIALQTYSGDDFQAVETIVTIFNKYNLDAGCCHDF